jgi:hypothetical protein
MAIAFDAVSNGAWSSGTSFSWQHTVSGSDRLLVVAVAVSDGQAVTSVTFGAQSFTFIRRDANAHSSELWYLVAPNTGTGTITVNFGSAPTDAEGAAVSLTGVAQSGTLDANTGTTLVGTSVSVSITTVADNAAIVDVLGCGGSGAASALTIGAQTNRVSRVEVETGPNLGMSTLIPKVTAGSQTMDWTLSPGRVGGLSVASFKPAAAAFEIDAQPGSFAFTGQLSNGAIAAQAAPGSYAAAGAAATFVLDVPATAGAYSWTGVLSQNEIAMPASPGAVAWTGVLADLAHTSGLTLDAQPGAFAIAGAASSAAIGANAAPGAYAHTGAAAGFALDLPAAAGAITWSGVATGLLVGYVLVASPGAVAWSGAQADLVVTTLALPAEGFTLPGRAVDFTLALRAADFDLRARPTDLVNPKEQ